MSVNNPPRLLIVSSCTKRKSVTVVDPPTYDDLTDPVRRAVAWNRLVPHVHPARNLYHGSHHLAVLGTVDHLRAVWPQAVCDVVIISAGFGLLREDELVIPYDATFRALPARVARARAERLAIRTRLAERLAHYDLAVFLLSATYLGPLVPPLAVAPQELYFVPSGFSLSGPGIVQAAAGVAEARRLHVSPRMVKAALFERFVATTLSDGLPAAVTAAADGDLLRQCVAPPQYQQLALIER